MKRRGILPETIHEVGREIRLSTAEPVIDWSLIESINRKRIDPTAKRYFFVPDPISLIVRNAPEMKVTLSLHPTEDLGERTLAVGHELFIPRTDADEVRLKDLYTIHIIERGDPFIGEYVEGSENEVKEIPKIQWVPQDHRDVEILVPDLLFIDEEFNPESLTVLRGVAERSVESLSVGEIIQFERFGFCRMDAKGDVYRFVFTHR
jgi:glutamyl-tRNA synthetase